MNTTRAFRGVIGLMAKGRATAVAVIMWEESIIQYIISKNIFLCWG